MVILIAGSSHAGKTLLAQKILEKYKYSYLSIDHLKMGLIRSGHTELTPQNDGKLTGYLWPIVREIIKTAIENGQNLTVEGCYIPFSWKEDFGPEYLGDIEYRCLVMTEKYIQTHYDEIKKYENIIERRSGFSITKEELIRENIANIRMCKKYDCKYILIDGEYAVDAVF